jgi:hypothetical protein
MSRHWRSCTAATSRTPASTPGAAPSSWRARPIALSTSPASSPTSSSTGNTAVESGEEFLDQDTEETEDGFIELVALIDKILTETESNDQAL